MSMWVCVIKKKSKLYYYGHPLPKSLKYCDKPLWKLYKCIIGFLSFHSDIIIIIIYIVEFCYFSIQNY